MARPRKEIDQKQFENLCGLQCTKEEICGFFDITDKTLDAWCRRTYKQGFSVIFAQKRGKGKISLRRHQFRLAESNASMAIWLGKQYLDQKEPMDERRLEVELLKLESRIKDIQPGEEADDGMLDALNGVSAEVWGGGDNNGGTADGCAEEEDSC